MNLAHGVQVRSLGTPDTTRTFLDGSERAAVELGTVAIGLGVYRPGWRWSHDARPSSGRGSAGHVGYVISGRMRVRGRDGSEADVGAGDAFVAAPGHDAWVVGDEPCVALDFSDVRTAHLHATPE